MAEVLGVSFSIGFGKKRPRLSFLKVEITLDKFHDPFLPTAVFDCWFIGWPGKMGIVARNKWCLWARNREGLVPRDADIARVAAEAGALKVPEKVRIVEDGDFWRLDAIKWEDDLEDIPF